MGVDFIPWAVIQYHCYLFHYSNYSGFVLWELVHWHVWPFDVAYSFLSTWKHRYFRLILYLPWFGPGIGYFCLEALFIFLKIFRDQNLGVSSYRCLKAPVSKSWKCVCTYYLVHTRRPQVLISLSIKQTIQAHTNASAQGLQLNWSYNLFSLKSFKKERFRVTNFRPAKLQVKNVCSAHTLATKLMP